jgi:hypothetical protein
MPTRYDLFGLGFNTEDTYYHHKVFEELLYDAVLLAYMSSDLRKEDESTTRPNSLARASVVSSILSFECAANCCIGSLSRSRALLDDIDKLPFLSKFELFLTGLDHTKALDRGCLAVQHASELKKIRDQYVHLKVKRFEWKQASEREQVAEAGETPLLKIPLDMTIWEASVAVSALKAITNFFNYFFIDLCNFDSNTTCEILLGSQTVQIPSRTSYSIDCVGDLDRAINEWGISFRFLGKG